MDSVVVMTQTNLGNEAIENKVIEMMQHTAQLPRIRLVCVVEYEVRIKDLPRCCFDETHSKRGAVGSKRVSVDFADDAGEHVGLLADNRMDDVLKCLEITVDKMVQQKSSWFLLQT